MGLVSPDSPNSPLTAHPPCFACCPCCACCAEIWNVMDLVSPDCLGSKKDFTNGISNPMMRGQKSTATDFQKAEVGKGGRGARVRAWAGADWLAHRRAVVPLSQQALLGPDNLLTLHRLDALLCLSGLNLF